MTRAPRSRRLPGRNEVAPTHDDSMLGGVSAAIGGPEGAHSARHPWWTPVRVLLLLTALCFAAGMVQKAGCYSDTWSDNDQRYEQMCYSDLPYLYTGRGFVEHEWPYSDDTEVRAKYDVMEYPVGISYFAWGMSYLTQWVDGTGDISDRADTQEGQFWGDPQVQSEIRMFVALSALAFALCTLLSTWLLAGVNPGRPWDALAFAVSPALALTGLVNWDLLAVVLVAGALWAWARDRPVLTGVLIGLGCATKLYPLFLLGGLLVICARRRRWGDFAAASIAAAAAWVLANAPGFLTGPQEWKVFWTFNSDRGGDLGSLWLVLREAGWADPGVSTINQISWLFFGVWCVAVLLLGLWSKRTPRFAQLGFLIVAGFLLINKVYSPQYVLWLLPLAVLARPRWRDLLIWQAAELFYFCSVWWYLGGFLNNSDTQATAPVYWIAVGLRLAAEIYLVAVVVRDILRPEHDPVPREGPNDPLNDPPDDPSEPWSEDYEEISTRSKSVAV